MAAQIASTLVMAAQGASGLRRGNEASLDSEIATGRAVGSAGLAMAGLRRTEAARQPRSPMPAIARGSMLIVSVIVPLGLASLAGAAIPQGSAQARLGKVEGRAATGTIAPAAGVSEVKAGDGGQGADPVQGTGPATELGSVSGVALARGMPTASAPAIASPARVIATVSSCTPEFGSFGTGKWPSACWHPYGPESPFNFQIPASPKLAAESAAIVKYIRGHGWTFEGNAEKDFTWHDGGSRPVYWPTSTDPLIKVKCRENGNPCLNGMEARIPVGARPQEASDGHMTVVEQTTGREYDFWQATTPEKGEMFISGGNWIAIGNNSGTGLGGFGEAAYLGLLGGIVRAQELFAGKIEHALVTTVKCVQLHDVWPAPESKVGDAICPYEKPGPHFGTLLQLNMTDAEIAASGAPSWQQTIMTAMARYGVYVVDTGGKREKQMRLLSEDDLSFTSFGYSGEMAEFVRSQGGTNGELVGVPINLSKLRVIDPCVPRKTC
jgi:hypothetical protein